MAIAVVSIRVRPGNIDSKICFSHLHSLFEPCLQSYQVLLVTGSVLEGDIEVADEVVLLEDVTTTAGSAVRAVEAIREGGAVVDKVVVIIDRAEGGTEALAAVGAKLIPILTVEELRSRTTSSW